MGMVSIEESQDANRRQRFLSHAHCSQRRGTVRFGPRSADRNGAQPIRLLVHLYTVWPVDPSIDLWIEPSLSPSKDWRLVDGL